MIENEILDKNNINFDLDNIIKYSDDEYIFYFKKIKFEIDEISPIIELYRQKLIQNIKKDCKKYFKQKKLNIDIHKILPRWIMLQYKNESFFKK